MGVKRLRRRGTYGILIGRCAGRRCVASMLWVVRCYAHHVGPIEAKCCLDVMGCTQNCTVSCSELQQ